MELVSIIVPAYNRIDELVDAVKSILNQSYKNIEILIIDDYSTVDIHSAILLLNSDKIKYFKTNQNVGVTEARKFGIENLNGDLITFLDDDDYISPNCIEDKVKLFQSNPKLNFVMSDYLENNLVNKNQIPHSMEKFAANFKVEICNRPGPFFQCCMFKRELIKNYNLLFDNKAIPSEDWDFFLNISKLDLNIGYINQLDFTWNYSENSQSANFYNEANGLNYILQKHKKLFLAQVGKSKLSDHYRMVARVFEKDNNFIEAAKNYKTAFKVDSLNYKNVFYFILLHLGETSFNFIVNKMRKLRGHSLG